MAGQKKLQRWAEKLLNTDKRNNLINFKDTKRLTAELVFPDNEIVFSKCSISYRFEVIDSKSLDNNQEKLDSSEKNKKIIKYNNKKNKYECENNYYSCVKSGKYISFCANSSDSLTVVRSIAKKAMTMQDETGVNVAYLAFGFLEWNDKEGSAISYRAP